MKAIQYLNAQMDENQVFVSADPFVDPNQNIPVFKEHILELSKTFNAFIFSEDYLALKGTNIFKEHGFKIPEDIALIGHDNSIFSLCSQPELTTIDTKISDMSTVVANTMHSIFLKEPVGESTILRPELVIRGTT